MLVIGLLMQLQDLMVVTSWLVPILPLYARTKSLTGMSEVMFTLLSVKLMMAVEQPYPTLTLLNSLQERLVNGNFHRVATLVPVLNLKKHIWPLLSALLSMHLMKIISYSLLTVSLITIHVLVLPTLLSLHKIILTESQDIQP